MPKREIKKAAGRSSHFSEGSLFKVEIPDEAISYIVQRYLSRKSVEGVPLVVGISTDDVEAVLSLFIEWAAHKNYVKDGILFIGGNPVG